MRAQLVEEMSRLFAKAQTEAGIDATYGVYCSERSRRTSLMGGEKTGGVAFRSRLAGGNGIGIASAAH